MQNMTPWGYMIIHLYVYNIPLWFFRGLQKVSLILLQTDPTSSSMLTARMREDTCETHASHAWSSDLLDSLMC